MANDTDNLKFVGAMIPKKLTSFDEDFKYDRIQIIEDQKRFAKYGTNSIKLTALMEPKQVVSASELVKIRDEEVKSAAAFQEEVQSDQSHNRTRTLHSKVKAPVIYTREPTDN